MSEPSSAPRSSERTLTARDVAAYLRRHPGFLLEHTDLLAVLTPPCHRKGDDVVDMQSFMIERLRREVERLKSSQNDLIATARGNLSSQARVHAAVLDLIGARSFEHLIESVTTDLALRLDVDVVSLCVECDRRHLPPATRTGVCFLEPGTIDRLMGTYGAILGPDRGEEPAVFGAAASLVRSHAFLRLNVSPAAPVALLALGSRHEDRFEPGHGTELLAFLAGVLEHTIRSWLDLPA